MPSGNTLVFPFLSCYAHFRKAWYAQPHYFSDSGLSSFALFCLSAVNSCACPHGHGDDDAISDNSVNPGY